MKPVVEALALRYRVTHVLWHQGESDLAPGANSDRSGNAFLSFAGRPQGRRHRCPDLRFEGLAVRTGLEDPRPRAHAQQALVDAPITAGSPGMDTTSFWTPKIVLTVSSLRESGRIRGRPRHGPFSSPRQMLVE